MNYKYKYNIYNKIVIMLKLHQIIKENKIEFEKLPAFDKKVLNLIHQKVINPYEEKYGNAIDPIDSAEELIEDIDLISQIYNFLKETMELGSDSTQSFIDLLVSNFRPDGNYTNLSNAVYKPKEQEPYEKIYTKWANISPYFVKGMGQQYYEDMPVVYDARTEQHSMIGDKGQIERAVETYYQDIWWGDDDIIQALGEEEFIERLYVSNADARMMATEEANHMVEDMSDRDLLERIGDLSSPLRNEYDSLENEINDIEEWGVNKGKKSVKELENKKDNIIEQGRELLRREHYDHTYERLTEDLTDFLWDFGYISKRNGRDFVFGDHFRDSRASAGVGFGYVDLDKLPGWLQFDRDTFIQDEVQEAMDRGTFEMLSESDSNAGYLTYEGDTYYIIDIDY